MHIQENQPLKRYGTFQIGGPADFFVEVHSEKELLEALDWAAKRDLPTFVFGGGSNLLFDDAGFRGLVIRVRSQAIKVTGTQIQADAGVMTALVVKAALEAGLTGLEAWNGLPGTVGGAVYGNAGCFGVESKDILRSARVLVPGEGIREWSVADLAYDYRHSKLKELPGAVVLSARFQLEKGDSIAIEAKMKEIAKARITKQPPGLTTGSFFKNPAGHAAGALIDQCGLKGHQLGGAKISEHHANFFLNAGGASAADILNLAQLAKDKVKERFNLELEQEIIFVPAQ